MARPAFGGLSTVPYRLRIGAVPALFTLIGVHTTTHDIRSETDQQQKFAHATRRKRLKIKS